MEIKTIDFCFKSYDARSLTKCDCCNNSIWYHVLIDNKDFFLCKTHYNHIKNALYLFYDGYKILLRVMKEHKEKMVKK
jgi:hypothetical protein